MPDPSMNPNILVGSNYEHVRMRFAMQIPLQLLMHDPLDAVFKFIFCISYYLNFIIFLYYLHCKIDNKCHTFSVDEKAAEKTKLLEEKKKETEDIDPTTQIPSADLKTVAAESNVILRKSAVCTKLYI